MRKISITDVTNVRGVTEKAQKEPAEVLWNENIEYVVIGPGCLPPSKTNRTNVMSHKQNSVPCFDSTQRVASGDGTG